MKRFPEQAVTALTLLNPSMFDFLFFYPIVYVCIFNLIIGNGVFILLHMGLQSAPMIQTP